MEQMLLPQQNLLIMNLFRCKMSENKTRWELYKEKNGVTMFDVINPNKLETSAEEADSRYSICLSCPELINITKQCKKCGCFMAVKTKLKYAKCPIGKW